MKRYLLLIYSLYSISNAQAQICSAINLKDCGTTADGVVKGIFLRTKYDPVVKFPNLTCDTGASSKNQTLNSKNPIKIYIKRNYELEIQTTTPVTNTSFAVWIDHNMNGIFEASEYLISQSGNSNFFNIVMECTAQTGKTKMRIRTSPSSSPVTAGQGCGSLNISGSIFDLEMDIRKFSDPDASFTLVSDTNYSHGKLKFKITHPNPDFDYTIYPYSNGFISYPDIFYLNSGSASSKAWVSLYVNYCGKGDTMRMHNVEIIDPPTYPYAYFEMEAETVEIYSTLKVFSRANLGADWYNWDAWSPTGRQYSKYQENAEFILNELGTWNICHRAKNMMGVSSWNCKPVNCINPMGNYIGYTTFGTTANGELYDNGGPYGNYKDSTKPSKHYFRIDPKNTSTQLSLHQLKLADTGDRLKIYVGLGDTGIALHPPGGFTKGTFSQFPQTFISNSGKFYVTFESNSSGNDTGFRLSWMPTGKNKIKGYVYYDVDSNCSFSLKDKGWEDVKLKIGAFDYGSKNSNGFYQFLSDFTPKAIKPSIPAGWIFNCPVSGKDTWTLSKKEDINFGIIPDKNNPLPDVSTTLVSSNWEGSNVIRGADAAMLLVVDNVGNTGIDSVKCQLRSNKKLHNFGLNSGEYSGTDTSLSFKFKSTPLLHSKVTTITYKVPVTETGMVIFKCKCYPDDGRIDIDSSNNEKELKLRIVYAHDPNDKQVSVISKNDHTIEQLSYFVRFQNTGTWSATDVIIRDTLSNELDTNSLELLETSHTCALERRGYALAFKFLGIDLPDSGRNEPGSHGWFHYTVKPKQGLQEKKRIYNTAFIYFDAELPVVTNTTENFWQIPIASTYKFSSGRLQLYPVPAQDKLYFHLPVELENEAMVRIFALSGQKMMEVRTAISKTGNYLNTSDLPNGIYCLQILSGGLACSGKFAVSH